MKHVYDVVQNVNGQAISGASVTVRIANASPGTGALATIYQDDGITTCANPVNTAFDGSFSFWVADGRYDVTYSGPNVSTKIIPDIEYADISQSGSGDVPWKPSNINNILYVDGTRYATIAAAVTAAGAMSPPGMVIVPPGTANVSQVEMATGVTLMFSAGTFTNTNASGQVFVHFASGVSGACVCGQGIGTTILKNNSTGTQFGAIVKDEGTDNTIRDMTMDGNGNTTSTLITITTLRNHTRNLRLLHDTTINGARNYAWHARGGTEYDSSNVTINGGAIDGCFLDGTFGAISGGHFTDLKCENSPANGVDITTGSGNAISNIKFTNLQCVGNGTAQGTVLSIHDDQYGVNIYAPFANGVAITNLIFNGIQTTTNKGSGLRIKGNVAGCTFAGVVSTGNGGSSDGSLSAANKDSISLQSDTGASVPSHNYLQGYTRKGSGTNAISTDSTCTLNLYALDVGSDAISLASNGANDFPFLIKAAGGIVSMGAIDFSPQSLSGNPSAPAIGNVSGEGIVINSAAKVKFPGPTVNLKRIKADQGTALVAGDFALSGGWGNTAAVSLITGTDQGWQMTVTCGGSGIGANPTITLTFKDGTWTSAPICVTKQVGGSDVLTIPLTEIPTATTNVMTYNGTPVTAKTYTFAGLVMGR